MYTLLNTRLRGVFFMKAAEKMAQERERERRRQTRAMRERQMKN